MKINKLLISLHFHWGYLYCIFSLSHFWFNSIQCLIAVSLFTLNMSENLELCPKCKQGHLRDAGGVTIKREIEPPFRQTGSMRERICDQCGHRQIDQYLNEYGEPESDLLSGTATKANPEEKTEKI